jgi:hypothetical protein
MRDTKVRIKTIISKGNFSATQVIPYTVAFQKEYSTNGKKALFVIKNIHIPKSIRRVLRKMILSGYSFLSYIIKLTKRLISWILNLTPVSSYLM